MSLKVEVTGADDIRAMFKRIARPLQREALAATAEDARDYVKGEAGKHTKPMGSGSLEASVRLQRDGEAFVVDHDLQRAPHALFVHWGTKPHLIKPRRTDAFTSNVRAHTRQGPNGPVSVPAHTRSGKRMIRFAHGNGWVFAKVIHHPGYHGDAWMPRAAQRAPIDFARHVERIVARERK